MWSSVLVAYWKTLYAIAGKLCNPPLRSTDDMEKEFAKVLTIFFLCSRRTILLVTNISDACRKFVSSSRWIARQWLMSMQEVLRSDFYRHGLNFVLTGFR